MLCFWQPRFLYSISNSASFTTAHSRTREPASVTANFKLVPPFLIDFVKKKTKWFVFCMSHFLEIHWSLESLSGDSVDLRVISRRFTEFWSHFLEIQWILESLPGDSVDLHPFCCLCFSFTWTQSSVSNTSPTSWLCQSGRLTAVTAAVIGGDTPHLVLQFWLALWSRDLQNHLSSETDLLLVFLLKTESEATSVRVGGATTTPY